MKYQPCFLEKDTKAVSVCRLLKKYAQNASKSSNDLSFRNLNESILLLVDMSKKNVLHE